MKAPSTFRLWVFVVLANLIFLFPMVYQEISADDHWWHIKTGQIILERGENVRTDPFSFTFADKPWVNWEWLADVIMALFWEGFGMYGLYLLRLIAVGGALFFVLYRAKRLLPPIRMGYALPLFILAGGLLLLIIFGRMSDRPHLYAFLLLSLFAFQTDDLQRNPTIVKSAGVLAMMLIWPLIHPSWMLGLAFLGANVADLLFAEMKSLGVKKALQNNLKHLIVPVASLLLVFIVHDPTHYFTSVQNVFATKYLHEWGGLLDFLIYYPPPLLAFMALMLLFVWAVAINTKGFVNFRGLFLFLLLVMAWKYVRFTPAFAMLATPSILQSLIPKTKKWPSGRMPIWATIAIFIGLSAVFFRLPARSNVDIGLNINTLDNPVEQAAFLEKHEITGNAYTSRLNQTSYLIFALWPRVKVFIDGRVPGLYPDAFLGEFVQSYTKEKFASLLEKYPIDIVVLVRGISPVDREKATVLADLPHWKLVFLSDTGGVWLRYPSHIQKERPKLSHYKIYIPWLVDAQWYANAADENNFPILLEDLKLLARQASGEGITILLRQALSESPAFNIEQKKRIREILENR